MEYTTEYFKEQGKKGGNKTKEKMTKDNPNFYKEISKKALSTRQKNKDKVE